MTRPAHVYLADKLSTAACKRYHQHYNNALYAKAVYGHSVRYANMLIDDALALCGDPHRALSKFPYAEPARAFLNAFTEEADRSIGEDVARFVAATRLGMEANDRVYRVLTHEVWAEYLDGKTDEEIDLLVGEAHALCGDPFRKVSFREYSEWDEAFLALFAAG